MVLTIVYFAWVRERIGIDQEKVALSPGIASLRDLAAWLATRSEGHRAAFEDMSRIRVAVDQEFAGLDAPIQGAREIAFFPPVTGG